MNKSYESNINIKSFWYNNETLKIKWSFITTPWLEKLINEDRVWIIKYSNKIRLFISDWHWWEEASQMTYDYFLNKNFIFPKNKKDAGIALQIIEKNIYDKCWNKNLTWNDWEKTPETAFITIEIDNSNISILAYWDCRWFILNIVRFKFYVINIRIYTRISYNWRTYKRIS